MPEQAGMMYRTYELTLRADSEDREAELSFSSESVIDRGYYKEILDHSKKSVRMGRIRTGAPLLLDHDRTKQIGVIEKANIVDKVGRAVVRFGQSDLANEIYQDVKDKIRTLVSVGYRIYKAVLEQEDTEGLDTYRITDWEPAEISIVSVPADLAVGIGRNENAELNNVQIIKSEVSDMEEEVRTPETPAAAPAVPEPAAVAPAAAPRVEVVSEAESRAAIQSIRDAEQNRVREILAIGEQFNGLVRDEAKDAVKNGLHPDAVRKALLDKIDKGQHIDTATGNIGMTQAEVENYSFQRMIASVLEGDKRLAPKEWEYSDAVQDKTGNKPRTFFVPYDVLRANLPVLEKRTITTASGGTGLVGTDLMPQSFIEILRNRAVVMQLGARSLTGLVGNADIPKQSGAATAYWLSTETTDITLSDSAFTALSLTPKNVGAATRYTRNMLLQSNPDIEGLVIDDLANVLALAIDSGAINGDGTGGAPTGVLNTSGIGSVTGTSLGWAGFVEFETDVTAANAMVGGTPAYVMPAAMRGLFKTRERVSGYPSFIIENDIANGYPVAVTQQMPAATVLFGIFAQVILAMWGGLDILVDQITYAASGNVVIWAYQTIDVGVRHAGSFSAASTIT